ncbi:MAG: hypothetical protein C5B49_02415 [Bdellovibrio sp.]|nr:MAG: hypothetical protein C5B49_02415 [Bdellovibrio sp.]
MKQPIHWTEFLNLKACAKTLHIEMELNSCRSHLIRKSNPHAFSDDATATFAEPPWDTLAWISKTGVKPDSLRTQIEAKARGHENC